MGKFGGILIFIWLLFRAVFHSFDYDESRVVTNLYFVLNDLFYIGFALVIYGLRFSFMSLVKSKRICIIVLIYSLWVLIVDVLILTGIGAADTAIYTQVDIAIIGIGALWSFV
jgi:hypothetical protein